MPYEPIPATMQAVVLKDYDGSPLSLSVTELPIPALTSGQVLVKISGGIDQPVGFSFLTRPVRYHESAAGRSRV